VEPNRLRDQSTPNISGTGEAVPAALRPPESNSLSAHPASKGTIATAPVIVRRYVDDGPGETSFQADYRAFTGNGYDLRSVIRTPGSRETIVSVASLVDELVKGVGLPSVADRFRGHIVATFDLLPATALPPAIVNSSSTERVAAHEPKAESSSIGGEEARRMRSHWTARASEPTPSGQRIGWLAVGIAACAVILLAAYLAISESGGDPSDPGWADIAFGIGPLFAIAAAFVIGLVLDVVAAMELLDLTVSRAAWAMVVGLVGAPVVYLAVLLNAPFGIEDSTREQAFMIFMVPAICGMSLTLIPALVLSKWSRGRG
jgi:hypothetical protein